MRLTTRALHVGLAACAALCIATTSGGAQPLAQRVRAAGTGLVELHYTARAGVCGDGRGSFSIGERFHMGQWRGDMGDSRTWCQAGPARVRLRVDRGTITEAHVTVGPEVRHDERATDLGAVPSAEAASFFLALADSATSDVSRRAITAAVIADSTSVWRRLLAIASDSVDRARSTRHEALFWAGQFAAAKLAGHGEDIAAFADDERDDRDDARDAAVFALSQLRGHAGVEPLLEIARSNKDASVRRRAIFWLGESGDPRAIALFESILRG
ncbi:MAG TPA: HEAT repeat domain-containing protein [Gemmatimonadaceae bacterium]|jgi:hypothetical protein|nr:HEAT repeat domain-containing protein [Gemmatimonadaceae bacterium]